jgi:hypothetical protein
MIVSVFDAPSDDNGDPVIKDLYADDEHSIRR